MNAKALQNVNRILVAGNDPVLLKSLVPNLSARGYQVNIARTGPQATVCVRFQRPDLILLELTLPKDVLHDSLIWDGFLFISWLNALGKAGDIPVIVISDSSAEKYKNLSLESGAQAFFSKPLDRSEVLNAVHWAVEGTPELKAVSH